MVGSLGYPRALRSAAARSGGRVCVGGGRPFGVGTEAREGGRSTHSRFIHSLEVYSIKADGVT